MRILVPAHQNRISPVLDVARHFVLLDCTNGAEQERKDVIIENTEVVARAKKIVQAGPELLICGAISWPLESMLLSAGVHVIPNTCGMVNEVLEAFLSGQFDERAFLMPGCCGKRRHRLQEFLDSNCCKDSRQRVEAETNERSRN
jgi:predicted Fe-Mo cluster-binding NifX family protein